MPRLQKDVIAPGVYSKGNSVFVVTDRDTSRWASNHQQLSAAGYKVPVWFEHPQTSDVKAYPVHKDDAVSLKSYEDDTYFAGWADELFADDKHTLHVNHDPQDDKLHRRLSETGAFVSPQFGPWVDKAGKRYDSIISHIAITRKPVRKNQGSRFAVTMSEDSDEILFEDVFQSEPMIRSIDGCYVHQFSDDAEPVTLSMFDRLPNVMADVSGEQVQFALGGGGDMGGGPGAGGGVDGGASPDMMTQPVPEPGLDMNSVSGQTPASTLTANLKMSLAALGVQITPDSPIADDPKALAALQGLMAEVIAMAPDAGPEMGAAPEPGPDELNQENLDAQMGSGQVTAEPVIVTMSETTQTAAAQTPEPLLLEIPPTNAQIEQLQAQLSRLQAINTEHSRTDLRKRVTALFDSGRCDAAWRDARLAEIEQHQMSDDDESPTLLEERIADRESLPEGAVWTAEERVAQLSQVQEIPAVSGQFRGESDPTDEEVDAYMERAASL